MESQTREYEQERRRCAGKTSYEYNIYSISIDNCSRDDYDLRDT